MYLFHAADKWVEHVSTGTCKNVWMQKLTSDAYLLPQQEQVSREQGRQTFKGGIISAFPIRGPGSWGPPLLGGISEKAEAFFFSAQKKKGKVRIQSSD